jgi:hypothetical protein
VEIPHQSGWGGARAGAGRRAKGPLASEPHRVRPQLSPWHPVHVTARVAPSARGLDRRGAYRAIRRALHVSLARADFRIISLAVHAQRIELVVEADDRISLARGMQGFQVAAARHVNRDLGRHGTVFPDRYRARPLVTRSSVRALLAAQDWQRTGFPTVWLLEAYFRRSPGSPGSPVDALVSGWSGIRYSSPSHRPRSTR